MAIEKISTYITYDEAVKSQTAVRMGIENRPPHDVLQKMMLVGKNIHTPARIFFNKPIPVSSFYRSEKLNKAIGGAKNSQHLTGEAIDMDVDGVRGITNRQLFEWIKDNLEFDQLIWEYGDKNNPAWVHCSYKAEGNRNQVLYIGVK